MSEKKSDYVFHLPGGSLCPGMVDSNPYINYTPDDLRSLIKSEKNKKKLDQIKSALKQWERIYQEPGYPYRKVASEIRGIAYKILRIAETVAPPRNVPYYFDSVVPEGREEILDSLRNIHDKDNERFEEDSVRHGERPFIDSAPGDFLSPKEPFMRELSPGGREGPDPEGFEITYPLGGDLDPWPDML